MRKLALSFLVLAASAAYVWDQHQNTPAPSLLDAELLGDTPLADPAPAQTLRQGSLTPAVFRMPASQAGAMFEAAPARFTRVATILAANAGFVDGKYTGPAVNAYYGLIQIQASVQGGKLVSIKVLKYPSDRQTSIAINRQALPLLRDEAIAAQRAEVDIISGATLTSDAFIKSLGGALSQAH
ncbi:MAG: FMN-binding protein [Devosia sp.]|nr:FMN-binding protein [Devosia sp.]